MSHRWRQGMNPVIDLLHHTSFPDWLDNSRRKEPVSGQIAGARGAGCQQRILDRDLSGYMRLMSHWDRWIEPDFEEAEAQEQAA